MHRCNWKILIVEDEVDSLELMQTILGYQGVNTTGVQTAEEALMILNELKPTLILVDLALPAMDGWGFLRQLQVNPASKGIPKVAVTAYHTPIIAAKAIAAGFDAFFPKPIDAVTFVDDLEAIIASPRKSG
jgi:two-component system cell cycle response regulator/two-component system cell cycle response regulator DivK